MFGGIRTVTAFVSTAKPSLEVKYFSEYYLTIFQIIEPFIHYKPNLPFVAIPARRYATLDHT
jgi:hypothetical protein